MKYTNIIYLTKLNLKKGNLNEIDKTLCNAWNGIIRLGYLTAVQ